MEKLKAGLWDFLSPESRDELVAVAEPTPKATESQLIWELYQKAHVALKVEGDAIDNYTRTQA